MKIFITILWLRLLSVSHFIDSTDSHLCYECNSLHDSDCETIEKNSTKHLKECTDTVTGTKHILEVEESENSFLNNIGDIEIGINATASPQQNESTIIELESTTVETEKNLTICRKMVIRVYETYYSKRTDKEVHTSMWKNRVIRSCGYISDGLTDTICVNRRSPSNQQLVCSCTDGPGCNRATTSYNKHGGYQILFQVLSFTLTSLLLMNILA